jgi:Tol biopolymer transport system component
LAFALAALLARTLAGLDLAAAAVTTRESVDSSGGQSLGDSFGPAMTPDGQFVVFQSSAANLVPGDFNLTQDVFVHDRLAGTTERVSVATSGAEGNGAAIGGGFTPDGHLVVFSSGASNLVAGDGNADLDAFVHDRLTGTTECVSVTAGGVTGNGPSGADRFAITADER